MDFDQSKVQDIIGQIENEVRRRHMLGNESLGRKKLIEKVYIPKFTEIFKLEEKFLHPDFKQLAVECSKSKKNMKTIYSMMTNEKSDRVFSFPVFTTAFCDLILKELQHFNALDIEKGRPNTMNRYGVVLSELLEFDSGFLTELRQNYLSHISKAIYPEWSGDGIDSHRAFTVEYEPAKDIKLDEHYDNAEVTINICLGHTFEGGKLKFGGLRESAYSSDCKEIIQKPGIGILHRGQHCHSATPIAEGRRTNLIIWMRASSVRNDLCPMCDKKPSLVYVEGHNDGFTEME
ncbi:2-oxoglutarate and iron-dependent oxygenase domain-containing protein 2 [Nymphon striatum]|nr:2-oxoglutarate and iron-dependent oxygenase domain-containing protein 2 [Nymphon striatum]